MILAVAGQVTTSMTVALVNELQTMSGRRSNVGGVEIDQPGFGGHSMRIMASGASGLPLQDVFAVIAKTLETGQNHAPTVALVAKGVRGRAFGLEISQHQLAFEQRGIRRSMRPIRTGPAGLGARIIVMAIGAIHATGNRPWGDQARYH